MISKLFEVRDRGTFIPVLAISMNWSTYEESYLLKRAGYESRIDPAEALVLLVRIDGGEGPSNCDPYGWMTRTMVHAHQYIAQHFMTLESGAVIDVEYILGETTAPKASERETYP